MSEKLVSIIINNHNYGRFLDNAIESALSQSYSETEVIVVDDGSEDHSTDIIKNYRDRIIPVLKSCGGQASALNAGFAISTGEVIIFLDADDRLLPTAAGEAIRYLDDPDTVKVHWPMWIINENGNRTGALHPSESLPEGNFQEEVMEKGPGNLPGAPTSGNAWSRLFLKEIGPINEDVYRISADRFLIETAPFFGSVAAIPHPQGEYRIHGKNAYVSQTFEYQLPRSLAYYDHYAPWLAEHCRRKGRRANLSCWKKNSWWHKQAAGLAELDKLPPRPGSLILVGDGSWGVGPVAGWPRLPFLEAEGQFAGYPKNDEQAVDELERLRTSGAQYIVFPWHTSWWFDLYPGFKKHLQDHYKQVLKSETLIGFDLHPAC